MEPPGADTVLVRHSELGTKSAQVQARMEERLATNIARMLARREIPGQVDRERGRIFIRTSPGAIDQATTVATESFGVISASPTLAVPATEEAIYTALEGIAPSVYGGGTFAVAARRAGPPDAHPFSSSDLEERGGAAIWEAVADRFQPAVDLDSPDVRFYVECRENEAYLFHERCNGPGGFPIGTQGRTVALVSGGIDSPVAAWQMMRRGCEIVPVYFDFEQFGGPDHVARAVDTVRQLARYVPDGELDLRVVPIGDIAEFLNEEVGPTRMLSLRRVMFAIGEMIAEEADAHSLVTGESMGQKSSQTGKNLTASGIDTTLPIHRPLLDRDKQDIISHARKIGTYSTSTIPAGCNRIAPTRPETHANYDQVIEAEPPGLLDGVAETVDRADVITVSVAETMATQPTKQGCVSDATH